MSNELCCSKCGRKFNADEVGHVDDHIEICSGCMPVFKRTEKGNDVMGALNGICYFGKRQV